MQNIFHQLLFGTTLVNAAAALAILGIGTKSYKKYGKRIFTFIHEHNIMWKEYQYRNQHRMKVPKKGE